MATIVKGRSPLLAQTRELSTRRAAAILVACLVLPILAWFAAPPEMVDARRVLAAGMSLLGTVAWLSRHSRHPAVGHRLASAGAALIGFLLVLWWAPWALPDAGDVGGRLLLWAVGLPATFGAAEMILVATGGGKPTVMEFLERAGGGKGV